MAAQNYINSLKQKQHHEILTTLLKAQLENNAGLSEETRTLLEKQKEDSDYGAYTQIELFKEKCYRLYTDYKEPVETIQEVTNAYQKALKRLTDNMATAQNVRIRAGSNQDVESVEMINTYHSLLNRREPTIQIGESFHKINMDTGEVDEKPLINPLNFNISDFERYVVYGYSSRAIHVLQTLEKFIEYAETIGLTRKKFADILREFVNAYLPEHEAVISFVKDPDEVFKAIVNTVNYDKLRDQIRKAIRAVKREPEDSIELPLGAYRALIMEASVLENPMADTKEITKKADRNCIRTAQLLVEPNLAKEIEGLKSLYLVNMKEQKFEYKILIDFILKHEQDPVFKLKSTKQLADKTVAMTVFQMDFFQNMTDFVQEFNDTLNVSVNAVEHSPQNKGSYGGYTSQDQMRSRKDQFSKVKAPGYQFRKAGSPDSKYRNPQYSAHSGVGPGAPPHQTPPSFPVHSRQYPHSKGLPSPTRDQGTNAQPDTKTASTYAPGASRNSTPDPDPDQQDRSQRQQQAVHANERTRTSTNRPASTSVERRKPSNSPSFVRTRRGSFRWMDPNKNYPGNTKPFRRTPSGRFVSRSRERGNNQGQRSRRSRSCRLCGSTNHSRPASLNRVSSIPEDRRCPYVNIKEQTTACEDCKRTLGKNLYHPKYACVGTGKERKVATSRANSLTRGNGFNKSLN